MLVLCASWVRGSGKCGLDWLHGLGKLNGTIGLQELNLGAEIKPEKYLHDFIFYLSKFD